MNEHSACWICGSTATRPYRKPTRATSIDSNSFRITDSSYGETHGLRKCSTCGFVYAESLPDESLVSYYEKMDDPDYLASAWTRQIQSRRLLDTIVRHHKSATSLLDIGAGLGMLVKEAHLRGMYAEGIEPSRWLVQKAEETYQVTLRCGTLEECREGLGRFDVVTMTDVIEHTDDPMRLLQQASEMLAPDGLLAIVTPMRDSVAAALMGKRWWHYRVAHVGYFTRRSMRRALVGSDLLTVAEQCVGWVFPASYLCARLGRYLPFWPAGALLRSMANSPRLQRCIVPINLFDSRMFLVKKQPATRTSAVNASAEAP